MRTLPKLTAVLLTCACAAAVTLPSSDATAQVRPAPPAPTWWAPWAPFVVWYQAPAAPAPRSAPSPATVRPTPQPAPYAAPTVAPSSADAWPRDWSATEDEILVLTNQRRAQGAVCGGKTYAPAGPLTFDPVLRSAAREHSRDMGARNYFEHVAPDGRTPTDRMHAAGWSGRTGGENIYGGHKDGAPLSPTEVVLGWMESPGHCSNIMEPRYRTLGVGFSATPGSRLVNYWTQDFGG